MRISTACIVCRQRKVKCVHMGKSPCNYCRTIDNESNCVLYTTKEYRKIRGPKVNNNSRNNNNNLIIFENITLDNKEIKKIIEFALQHYPELFFLNLDCSVEKYNQLDPLLILSIYTLVSLFDKTIRNKKRIELNKSLENQFMTKLDDCDIDNIIITQCAIILLIINWQNGKTYKGYLIGGFAERAYKTLFHLNLDNSPIFKREKILQTLWSYQLITLSLRDESIEIVKSRLHKFRLPMDKFQLISGMEVNPIYIDSINNGKIHTLTSLLIMSSEIWIDCLSWLTKGGKYYFKEEPWDINSAWNKLENKILIFYKSLGINQQFSYNNLITSFKNDIGNIYCSFHLTLMISEIIIHRDFIPFIPSDTEGAKGPFDKLPWLINAPNGWWQKSASLVFETAKNISIILNVCKQNDKYSCNTFNGFIALTAASILSYIKHFPYYDNHFKDADIYYGYCLEYLSYYKSFLGIGGYYYKVLMQNEKIFDLAVKKGVSSLIITNFEQLKDEILDIANVSGPIDGNANYKTQLDKLFILERNRNIDDNITMNITSNNHTEPEPIKIREDQYRQELSSLMNWEFDWMSLENYQESWTPYIEEQ